MKMTDFPPEAYSYDSPVTKEGVARIQREADKILCRQEWTVLESAWPDTEEGD
jgi:hypothetical protein